MTVSSETLASISTPDRVESRLGVLEFDDGAPSAATADLLYEHLDFMHGVEGFLGAFPAASLEAVRRGFQSIGVEDNAVLLFSDLMDSASLFLTANCDTVYFLSFVDLSEGRAPRLHALERADEAPLEPRIRTEGIQQQLHRQGSRTIVHDTAAVIKPWHLGVPPSS